MKQTQNYQLNQWEVTDLIKMEDFNGDNSKVDAALHEAVQQMVETAARLSASDCFVKLVDITSNEEAMTQWDIDISSIDLQNYEKLIIHPQFIGEDSGTTGYNLYLDGVTDDRYSISYNNYGPYGASFFANCANGGRAEIELSRNGYQVFLLTRDQTWSGSVNWNCRSISTSYLAENGPKVLNFRASSINTYIHAGSRLIIYGVKR